MAIYLIEAYCNSGLASNEYFMPIMGLIFLRHATNRFYEAKAAIEADKAAGRMPDRPLVEADFRCRRALMLPEAARCDLLLKLPKGENLGAALNKAMEAAETAFPPLQGQLPKEYERFESDVLENMLRKFDSDALKNATGDVFGRVYEFFLIDFAQKQAHDNGEFFTPPSSQLARSNTGNRMKTLAAKEAKYGFGRLIDLARAPLMW